MIEVNLHPSGEKKRGRKKGGLSGIDIELPSLADLSVLDTFRTEPHKATFVVLLVVVPVLAGFLWWNQRSRAQELETRLEEARQDSTRLADLRQLSDSLTSRREEIRKRIDLVRSLDENRFVWPHLMDEIAAALPSTAWLRGFKQQSELPGLQLQLMGTAARPLVITRFVRNLEQSPFIGDVQIVGSNKQVEDGVATQAFVLQLTYSAPPRGAVRRAPVASAAGGE